MILLDYSGTVISSIMASYFELKEEITEEFIRHVVLNSIRDKIVRFKAKYGRLVICADGRNYWRREIFSYYKKGRKKARDESEFDWDFIYKVLNELLIDLAEYFPYKVVLVDRAEADDIIAVLVRTYPGPHVIISKDRDFLQLQLHKDVDQWDTSKKEFIKVVDPVLYLKEKVIRGDPGDGVPNILSPGNSFVDKIRQKPIYKKKLESWLYQDPSEFCDEEQLQRYQENRALIDLSMIPEEIQIQILEEYEGFVPTGNYHTVLKYLVSKNLKYLAKLSDEFIRGQTYGR